MIGDGSFTRGVKHNQLPDIDFFWWAGYNSKVTLQGSGDGEK